MQPRMHRQTQISRSAGVWTLILRNSTTDFCRIRLLQMCVDHDSVGIRWLSSEHWHLESRAWMKSSDQQIGTWQILSAQDASMSETPLMSDDDSWRHLGEWSVAVSNTMIILKHGTVSICHWNVKHYSESMTIVADDIDGDVEMSIQCNRLTLYTYKSS